ncbi:MAG: hypothetical protein J0I41_14580 [Filimonas sp.]|nr:hypothetical protein [Filimonas sp.]
MKISKSVRDIFSSQETINKVLAERVKQLLGENKKDNWFYKGRVKQLESFAQKLETGRFVPNALEDFFACTIVVENRHAIVEAVNLVERFCTIQHRRPQIDGETHKTPDLFSFDDLRLYVKLKPSETGPPTELDDILFEIQIKTFLQHAWSIATHDLIYKGDSISWGKERVAFQIKAMLEHAEVSIDQVDVVSVSSALAITDTKTSVLKDILTWIKENWSEEVLPSDIVRLSKSIQGVMSATKLELDDIRQAIAIDTENGYGTNAKNLSPYEIVVKAIFNNKKDKFLAFLGGKPSKTKLFITPEMEIDIPSNTSSKNLIFANSPKRTQEIKKSIYLSAPLVSPKIDIKQFQFPAK